jgi:hypothetical protein
MVLILRSARRARLEGWQLDAPRRASRAPQHEERRSSWLGLIRAFIKKAAGGSPPFCIWLTQANVGFAERNCFVIARNSPLATELVTAQPGDERDVPTRGGERYLNVDEVRTFEGPVSLRSPSEESNFRSMAIRRIGQKRPIVLEDLRATIHRLDSTSPDEVESFDLQVDLKSFGEADCTWLASWSGVYLGETDEQSLGHQFFTRTTVDQERALNNPRGLTFVEGIAGAGKTSVALGRLKFFEVVPVSETGG